MAKKSRGKATGAVHSARDRGTHIVVGGATTVKAGKDTRLKGK